MALYMHCFVTLLLSSSFIASSAKAPGRFIYKESCGKFDHRRDALGLQPLKWRRLKITSPDVSAPVHLMSNSGKNCTLKPLFHVQALVIGEDVDIKQLSHVCHFDKSHKHLTAPSGTVTHVSCNQDKIAAMDELNSIPEASSENTPLPVRSREGKNINNTTDSPTNKEATQQDKMSVSSTKTTPTTTTTTPTLPVKDEVSTGSNLVRSTIIMTSSDASSLASAIPTTASPPTTLSSLSPNSSTMEDDITTNTFSVSEESSNITILKNYNSVSEESSNITVLKHYNSYSEESFNITIPPSVVSITMVTVTIDPFFTSTTVFSAGVPDIFIYTSIIIGALLLILIIICSRFIIHKYRTRRSNTEINQKLVKKRENVINFRNAEEAVISVNQAQAEVKYLTLGSRRSNRNSTIITGVPKCLK